MEEEELFRHGVRDEEPLGEAEGVLRPEREMKGRDPGPLAEPAIEGGEAVEDHHIVSTAGGAVGPVGEFTIVRRVGRRDLHERDPRVGREGPQILGKRVRAPPLRLPAGDRRPRRGVGGEVVLRLDPAQASDLEPDPVPELRLGPGVGALSEDERPPWGEVLADELPVRSGEGEEPDPDQAGVGDEVPVVDRVVVDDELPPAGRGERPRDAGGGNVRREVIRLHRVADPDQGAHGEERGVEEGREVRHPPSRRAEDDRRVLAVGVAADVASEERVGVKSGEGRCRVPHGEAHPPPDHGLPHRRGEMAQHGHHRAGRLRVGVPQPAPRPAEGPRYLPHRPRRGIEREGDHRGWLVHREHCPDEGHEEHPRHRKCRSTSCRYSAAFALAWRFQNGQSPIGASST